MVSLFLFYWSVWRLINALVLFASFLALHWFKEHFIKCNERATLVKTWLPATYDGPKSWLDQLVYDRALVLVCVFSRSLRFHHLLIFMSTNRAGQPRAKSYLTK
jgi:hypothetical protein